MFDLVRHQWPVKFVATYSDSHCPAKIFVMQRAAPGGFTDDVFSCVASAIQMDDLPADEPVDGTPFYRTNIVTVLCANEDMAFEFACKVVDAAQDLANNIYAASVLEPVETITINPTNAS